MHRPHEGFTVLLIADDDGPASRAVEWTASRTCRVERRASAGEAAAALRGNTDVRLVVFVLPRPGKITEADVMPLRRAAPLTPVVLVHGSWCEGEMRRSEVPPAAVHVAWHRFEAWWADQWQRLKQGKCPLWGMPVTLTPEEWCEYGSTKGGAVRRGLVVIAAAQLNTFDGLAEACRSWGWSTAWRPPDASIRVAGASAGILDVAFTRESTADEVAAFHHEIGPVPLFVLANFPRSEDVRQWRASGATAVLAKPFSLGDLAVGLSGALPVSQPERRQAAA